jgi:hypothetical protein
MLCTWHPGRPQLWKSLVSACQNLPPNIQSTPRPLGHGNKNFYNLDINSHWNLFTRILWKPAENPNEQIRLTTQVNCRGWDLNTSMHGKSVRVAAQARLQQHHLTVPSPEKPSLVFGSNKASGFSFPPARNGVHLKETTGTLFQVNKCTWREQFTHYRLAVRRAILYAHSSKDDRS